MSFLGAFGDGLSVGPSSSHHRRSSSRSRPKRGRSRSRSRNRGTGNSFVDGLFGESSSSHRKEDASRAFFGLGNSSRSSFFGFGRPSYYKRSPRSGFMHRAYKQLKRLIRDLVHYAKRHPWKVFFLVIMPLVSGGALTALLARFGLRLPPSLERMLGMASRAAAGGGGFGLASEAARAAGNYAGGSHFPGPRSRGFDDFGGGYSSSHHGRSSDGGFGGWEDSIMGVAKMFI